MVRSPSKPIAIDIGSTPSTSPSAPSGSASGGQPSPLLKGLKSSDLIPPPSFGIEDARDRDIDANQSWTQRRIMRPLHAKVVAPAISLLKSGATAEGLALSLAFGLTGGLFPVPATTTLVCLLFVLAFRLNVAAVQLVNLCVTPLNLATFLSFVRWGEWMFGAEPVMLNLDAFKSDPLHALATFWISLCYGVVAWAIFTPPATFAAYMALKPLLRRLMASMFAKPD